ncbi:MAG: hypothetical protein K6C34_00960 [Alphaproteobacteria bacterium]|nr:hypothetical protein [Alphaproteobacteria bacterium]
MPGDYLQKLWVDWMNGELPPVSGKSMKEYEDEYCPLLLHNVDYYRRQNAALKAKGRKKKKGKRK